ncbi:FMRFamide receptor-like [Tubulanus polymorphus]|uniref:FMRFamide receptor-like n=1 Tax=Tubulanus polymorphus TaxID=672921 RepID=UPI003DA490CE
MNATTTDSWLNSSLISTTIKPVLEPSYTSYIEYKISKDVYKYVAPTIVFMGLAGNLLTICVLLKKNVGKASTSYLLVALALADSFVLITGLMRYWIREITQPSVDLRTLSPFSCKLHLFLVYYMMQFAIWILVLVTIERFISVAFPLKAKWLCSPPRMLAALGVMGTFLFALNSHIFYGKYGYYSGGRVRCAHLNEEYKLFWNETWVWIDLCVMSVVPFLTILFCNVVIIVKVRLSSRHKMMMRRSTERDSATATKITNMTAMLLTVNFVFLITSLPASIYLAGWTNAPYTSNHNIAARILAFASVNTLSYVNNAANFLLYCVSGPRFRAQFLAMIGKKSARIYPTSQTMEDPDTRATTVPPNNTAESIA